MSNIAFAYKPTIVIATVSREFADCGYSSSNILVIRKINAGSWQTYDPTLAASSISGFEKGAAYLFVSKIDLDLTGLAYNTLPENYESTTGNNIFANTWFAGIARQTATFSTIGFNASNLRIIYRVDIPYESYDPNEAASAISGIVEGQCYLGFALADQDVSAYFIPPVSIKDDITRDTDEFKYFGTTDVVDGTGATVKDFYNVPVRFFADEASLPATGVENIVYVAKAEKTSWYWDGAAYQQIGGGGGGTQDLQSVTDVGYTTNNPLITTSQMRVKGDSVFVVANASTDAARGVLGSFSDAGYLGLYDGNRSGYGVKVKPITTVSGYREILLPDKDGTFALLDDVTSGAYTDEMAQDATAALFAAGTHTGITFTYDDAGNKISAAVTGGGSTPGIDDVLAVGQSLTANRTIDTTSAFVLNISGAVPSSTSQGTLQVTNTSGTGTAIIATASSTNLTAIKGTATSGTGVMGTGSTGVLGSSTAGPGVNGTSGSSNGVFANSTSGNGILAKSTSGKAADFVINPTSTNTIAEVLRVERQTSGTAANGIGGSIDLYSQIADFSTRLANQIVWKWLNTTLATRTSQLTITGVNASTTVDILTLGGEGFMKLNPITATAASAITASDGMIVYVSSTDATFTSVGFWGRQGGTWIKL